MLKVERRVNIGHEVFILDLGDQNENSVIRVVDLRTGQIDRTMTIPYCANERILPLGSDRLLVEEEQWNWGALHILDRQSLSEMSSYEGGYTDRKCLDVSEHDNVVALTEAGRVDVLCLEDDDNLVLHHSFQVARPDRLFTNFWLHRSHVYVACDRRSPQAGGINVYNINTGSLDRRLVYPTHAFGSTYSPACMVATNTSLLVGFYLTDPNHPNAIIIPEPIYHAGCTIKAYAL